MGNQQSTAVPFPSRGTPRFRISGRRSRLPKWLRKKDIRRAHFRDQSYPIFTETTDDTRGTTEHVERVQIQTPCLFELGASAQPVRKEGLLKRSAEKIKAGLRSVRKSQHQRLADPPTTAQEMPGRSSEIERLQQTLQGVAVMDWAKQASRDEDKGKQASQAPEPRRSGASRYSNHDASLGNQARDESDNVSQGSEMPLLTQLSLEDEQAGQQKPIKYHYKWPYELKRPDAPDDEETFELHFQPRTQAKANAERKRLGDIPKLPELYMAPEMKFEFDFDNEASAAGQQESDGKEFDQKESEEKESNKKESDQKETGQKEMDPKDAASNLAKVSTVNVDELDPEHGLKPATKELPTGAPKTGTSI